MIIERLELENWMSYPRRWVGGGRSGDEEIVPTIDLTTESLILIAGENGAGKSAILEAICYALFAHYPRGKNPNAIRSGEKTAKIRLSFSLPTASGKARYRVERLLTAKAGSTNAALVQIHNDGSEEPLRVGQSDVTNHIQDVLLRGVTYEAFVSTIFLRQDAAGKFMGLSPEEQGEQLLHLCHLEIYHQIHTKAESLRKSSEKTIENLGKRFTQVEYATEAYLSTRRGEVQKLSKQQSTLRKQEKIADNLLQQVKRVATLRREIEGLEQKFDEWRNILEQAEKIRHANQWQIVWQRVKNYVTQGQEKFSSLQTRKEEIEQTKLDLKAAKEEASSLEAGYTAIQGQYFEKNELLGQLRDNIPILINEKDDAGRKLQDTRQAKKLDEDIARITQEQANRKIKLADFDEVQHKRNYVGLLSQAQTALKYTLEKLKDAQAEQKTAKDKEFEAQTATNTSAELQEIVVTKKELLKEIEEKAKTLGEEALKLGRQIGQAGDIIENRTKAFEAGECPVCGTEMIGDVGQHVQQEISNLQKQIEISSKQLGTIGNELATCQAEIERLTKEIKNQENEVRRLDSQIQAAKEASAKATKRVGEHQAAANNHWQKHLTSWQEISAPDWFTKPSVEVEAKIEQALAELKEVESKYNELTKIQASFISEATLLQKYESNRAELLIASPISEAQVMRLEEAFKDVQKRLETEEKKRDDLAKEVKNLDEQVRQSNQKWDDAKKKVGDEDKLLNTLETLQESDQENLTKIRTILQNEQQQLEAQFPDLANDLLQAVDDTEANARLEASANQYAIDAGQLEKLQEAETESSKVETEIVLKRKDFNLLLGEVGEISEDEALGKLARLQEDLKELDSQVANTNIEVGNIEAHHQERQEIEPQLSKAKSENWAYRTIEEAIYPGTKTKLPGPLWTQITQKLMESIGEEATRILRSLGWPIEIAYQEKEGFCIKHKTFGNVIRKYTEFSGGERFAIAITVALAIGQVTHGAGNVRCLFIDEGFGSLDTKNRGRITTDAIGKLIERGLRDQVVVITHLEDMKGFFPHRISLVRKDDCSCLASPEEELV